MRKAITCFICGAMAFAAVFTGILGTVDRTAEDMLYHKAGKTNGNIRIIKIDDRTMNQLGDLSAWDRDIYAQLVEILCVSEEVRPAVIGFDVLFSSQKSAEGDARFVEVCDKYGNVITAFSYVFTKELLTDEKGNLLTDTMSVQEKVVPYEALRTVTEQGFANALMDEDDSIIRSSLLYFEEKDGTRTQSFSAAVYEKYMEVTGGTIAYPTDERIMGFRYSGKLSDYENVSLIDVLNGTVPAETFDDCIVLIGAYAPGMMDAYFVPVDRGQQMYGVEIQANVIQAIMEGRTLTRVSTWIDAVLAAVVAVLLVLVCEKLSVIKLVLTCVAVAITKLVIGYFVFQMGYATNVLVIPLMSIVIAVYYTALHYYRAKAAKQSIEKAFSKYVAPQVVDEIAKSGTYELKLGGENRDIAALFVDIRGFTPLSESLEPEQVVDILNGYLELTTRSIFRHGGTLDKFIGDATMAVFNAPFDTEDYVYKAVLTAWDIVQGGNKIEKEYVARYGKQVGFGVGVNCGPAVVGNIGCEFRMDYTAIGDTVNTAARLESNAPRGTVYISEAVYNQLKDRIMVEEVGEIPLKGKSKGVFVYSVTGIKDYTSPEGV